MQNPCEALAGRLWVTVCLVTACTGESANQSKADGTTELDAFRSAEGAQAHVADGGRAGLQTDANQEEPVAMLAGSSAPAAGASSPGADDSSQAAGQRAGEPGATTAGAGGNLAAAASGAGSPAETAGSAGRDGTAASGGSVPSVEVDTTDPNAGQVIPEPEDLARYVFDQDHLRTYNIVLSEADLALIDRDPIAETYVNATLELEGQTIGPVSVRYKGSEDGFLAPCTDATSAQVSAPAGPMSPPRPPKTGKCSIKIDFNRVDPALRFYGLKKLNFHSMGRDKSMMRDRLGYSLFRESGIAAPRATHARLLINGKLEGLYVVVEQIDGRFTDSRFSDGGNGNLYKEVWPVSDTPELYLAALETNNEVPMAAQVVEMQRFHAAIAEGADASLRWLDLPYLFNYIAVDRVIANDDGVFHWYCQWNHNFYWYEAERADRVWLIPWDLDSSFQNGTLTHIDTPWNAPAPGMDCACGPGGQRPAICDPLMAYWASRTEDYQRAVDNFLAGPFTDAAISAKLVAWTQQIDAVVQEASGVQGAPTYSDWQEAFASLQAIIASSRMARGYAYDTPMMP